MKVNNTKQRIKYYLPFHKALLIHVPFTLRNTMEEPISFKEVTELLLSCDRVGYIGKDEELDAIITYANNNRSKLPQFKKGKDTLAFESKALYLDNNYKIAKDLYVGIQRMVEIGIFHICEKLFKMYTIQQMRKSC